MFSGRQWFIVIMISTSDLSMQMIEIIHTLIGQGRRNQNVDWPAPEPVPMIMQAPLEFREFE